MKTTTFYIWGDEGQPLDSFDVGEAPSEFMNEELGLEEVYPFEFAYGVVYDYLKDFCPHEEIEAKMADYFGAPVDSPHSYQYAYKIEGEKHQYVTEAGLEEYIRDKLKKLNSDYSCDKVSYPKGGIPPFPYM
jgi:hypothetical protein